MESKFSIANLKTSIIGGNGLISSESIREGLTKSIKIIVANMLENDPNADTERLRQIRALLLGGDVSIREIATNKTLMHTDQKTGFIEQNIIGILTGSNLDAESYQQILRTDELKIKLRQQFAHLRDQKHLNGLGASKDGMLFLIHSEKEKRKESFNCYFVDGLDTQKDFISSLKELIEKNPKRRFQIIVKSLFHYATIDIDPQKKTCFILDAANDVMYIKYLNDISKNLGYKIFVASGKTPKDNIQKDFDSCPIFAFHHARTVSAMDNVYEILEKKAENKGAAHFIEWYDLPPELIQNVQSDTFLHEYIKRHPAETEKVKTLTHLDKEYSLKKEFKDYQERFEAMEETPAAELWQLVHEEDIAGFQHALK